MNMVDQLVARIEEYRATNKNPCKNYSTKEAADKATADIAQRVATHFDINNRIDCEPARYIVFFNEAWGRWVGAVDMTELLNRRNSTGGYIGFCSSKGFYTF